MNKGTITAVIPVKGNSTRLPNKNILLALNRICMKKQLILILKSWKKDMTP